MKEYIVRVTKTPDYIPIEREEVVRELVRCKDCKHSQSYEKSKPFVVCHKHQSFNEPDWFCKDGEREGES